jgi:outer membrane protein TolC
VRLNRLNSARSCRSAIRFFGLALVLAAAAPAAAGDEPGRPVKYRPWHPAPGDTSASASSPWTPDAADLPTLQELAGTPADFSAGTVWRLGDLIDYALRHNPRTRVAWHAARAAAAANASRGGAYLPTVDLAGLGQVNYGSSFSKNEEWQGALGPSIAVNYLLYDSGRRAADLDEARQALRAANWTHRSVIEDVMLLVLEAFYLHQGVKTLVAAEETAVREAQAVLDSATERHRAGVATIADVLQARSALAQARLALQTATGDLRTLEGALAAAVGLPANTALRLADFQPEIPPDAAAGEVDRLIEAARRLRPDLAAAQAEALGAEARVRSVQAAGGVTVAATAGAGALYNTGWDSLLDNYSVGLTLRFPIFTGYTHTNNVIQAREDAAAARERVRSLAQVVAYEVWRSYYALQTAGEKIRTTEELLGSATQSYDVALNRYRAGVGDILDLLASQRTLEEARSEQTRARTEWLLAMARLGRSTGQLLTAGPAAATAPAAPPDKPRSPEGQP